MLETNAELQGNISVVVNAPTSNGVIKALYTTLGIPVATIINDDTDIQ